MWSQNAVAVEATKENIEDSESIASDDSEEMTEYEEFEFEHRRSTCVANMKELEVQFAKLKEQLIAERNSLVDKKLDEIEDETAEEFVIPLKKLQMNMDFKIKLTTLMRDYRWKNIEHIYECEKESSRLTLENDMQSLLDKYKSNIESEIRQLEENRRQFELDFKLHHLNQTKLNNELHEEQQNHHKLNEQEEEQENDPHDQGNGSDPEFDDHFGMTTAYNNYENPCIVYAIHDQEMLEDLSIIQMHNELSRTVSTEC